MDTPRAAWAAKRFHWLDGSVRFLGANLSTIFWIHCVVFLLVVILTGLRQDYELYVRQWRVVWEGYDPWTTPIPRAPHSPNAYGPLHLIFVPLSVLHPLLPKVLFASAWLWSQKEV